MDINPISFVPVGVASVGSAVVEELRHAVSGGEEVHVGRGLAARLRDTLMAISLGIGMCVSQTRAVLEGLLPGTGVFVRTPKRGNGSTAAGYRALLRGIPGLELALAAWFVPASGMGNVPSGTAA